MALSRLLARRGSVWSIWSDNGTNFIGANNELQKAMKEMDHFKVKNYLQRNGTDWTLPYKNPPGASHMGGMMLYKVWNFKTPQTDAPQWGAPPAPPPLKNEAPHLKNNLSPIEM